ncbi:PREDICTED: uncharacterized protein LOC104732532 [Camelina sativa]|uniref:Uncharacterized protein LOC104732532 n=1 Tax=Camelina sativa TaxID=90675 RepID=A0ABM0V3X8_CAMSA|nr:PREDICTED: uncharacterized protein LOC104732532 [Camelina sativa]
MMCGGNYTTIDSQKVSGSVPNQIYKWKKQEWNYDINLVTWSAGVFYGYVTIVPLALYVVLKYFFVPSGLVQLFCLCLALYVVNFEVSCSSSNKIRYLVSFRDHLTFHKSLLRKRL